MADVATNPTAAFTLEALEGPQMKPLSLSGTEPLTLGRGQRCQLRTAEGELSVSREHCRFERAGDGWILRDLASRHGTIVNDAKLAPETPHTLKIGDMLRLGPWLFRVSSPHLADRSTMTSMHDSPGARERLMAVTDVAMDTIHRRRLELLLDFSKKAQVARDEVKLAEAVVQTLSDATGYSVVAFIRPDLVHDQLQVLAVHSGTHRNDTVVFSRSLIRAAASGQAVKLRRDADTMPMQTNSLVGVQTALCVPVMVDTKMAGCLYLDCREGHMKIQDDAAAFCQAVADVCSMCLSAMKSVELELARTRNEEQMHAAMQIQQTILPPPGGRVLGVRYAMHIEPGRFIAGDLFDIFQIDDRRLAVIVGDVSGKGVPAAMLAALTQSYLTAALHNTGDLPLSMCALNRHLANKMSDNAFVSMLAVVIDVETRRAQVVDAGHGYWLLRAHDGTVAKPHTLMSGLPLRVSPELPYQHDELVLDAGSRLIFFSDGVVEQRSPGSTDEFGLERVHKAISASHSCEEDIKLVLRSVKSYAAGTSSPDDVDLSDDVTIASIQLPE